MCKRKESSYDGKIIEWTSVENARDYKLVIWDETNNALVVQEWVEDTSKDLTYKEYMDTHKYHCQVYARDGYYGYENSARASADSYGWYNGIPIEFTKQPVGGAGKGSYNITWGLNEEPDSIYLELKWGQSWIAKDDLSGGSPYTVEYKENQAIDGKTVKPGDTITVTNDLKLTAQWKWKEGTPLLKEIHYYIPEPEPGEKPSNNIKISTVPANAFSTTFVDAVEEIGAEKYMIFGNKCGKKNKYTYITTVTGTSYTAKKLKKGTYYKYTIVAVKGDDAIATSKTIHVVTDGGKKGNNTKVKLSKTKLTLNAGKTKTIKAKLSSKKKVSNHRKVAWESDNLNVAKVNSKGKITAVGKGTCYVYAYAQNGVAAKIKITVK